MRSNLFPTIGVLALSAAAMGVPARPTDQLVVVPAYFGIPTSCTTVGPGCSDPSKGTDWSRIKNAGNGVRTVVADGSFLNCNDMGTDCSLTAARNQFIANYRAGQFVLGYVDTDFGCDSTDINQHVRNVKTAVDNWYNTTHYPTQIQGIFFDDGPTLDTCGAKVGNMNTLPPRDESTIQRPSYGSVYSYMHTTYGGTVMLNASGFPHEWVLTDPAADQAVVFEDTEYNWINRFYSVPYTSPPSTPNWWSGSTWQWPRANIIYSASYMSDDVWRSKVSPYDGADIYVFDTDASSKGYNHLPSFFETMVAAASSECPLSEPQICVCPWGDYCTTTGISCQHICP